MIAICKYAKEAEGILVLTHESTSSMKSSKVKILTTKLESSRMEDGECFSEFYNKLGGMINSCFNLDDKILESKVVK